MIQSISNNCYVLAIALGFCIGGQSVSAATITGSPSADGWYFHGNSLANGNYVRGDRNLAFDMYTTQFTVTDSGFFSLANHDDSSFDDYYGDSDWTKANARQWEVGHTVIGIGGVFNEIAAGDAGWAGFTGDSANSGINGEYRFRLQAKIGTQNATWSPSIVAPDGGNGSGSTADGGPGTLLVRTSGWHELSAWEGFEGTILGLQNVGHLTASGATNPGVDAARVIWTWDETNNRVGSWELLVNMSLVEADFDTAGFVGAMPGQLGDAVISSVQIAGGRYTDALVSVAAVPEPGTIALAGLAGIAGLAIVRRRRGK